MIAKDVFPEIMNTFFNIFIVSKIAKQLFLEDRIIKKNNNND